jgi:hypothetical protein
VKEKPFSIAPGRNKLSPGKTVRLTVGNKAFSLTPRALRDLVTVGAMILPEAERLAGVSGVPLQVVEIHSRPVGPPLESVR